MPCPAAASQSPAPEETGAARAGGVLGGEPGLRHPLCREVARPLTRAAARPSAAEKLILDDTGAEENDSFRGVHPAAVGSELPWLTGAPA